MNKKEIKKESKEIKKERDDLGFDLKETFKEYLE